MACGKRDGVDLPVSASVSWAGASEILRSKGSGHFVETVGVIWIAGGMAKDERGSVSFVNDFDMARVRRMYRVSNSSSRPFRGWVAHRIEQKWFMPVSGRVSILLVKLDSFEAPSHNLKVECVVLDEGKPGVLHVPGGFAIGIRGETQNASVLVFSDRRLNSIPDDTWRWEADYWLRPC